MSKEGDPGVPKKGVFELDKDERWQARLDEARARREVALREKAAGIARKPRPKPWEIEGSDVEVTDFAGGAGRGRYRRALC